MKARIQRTKWVEKPDFKVSEKQRGIHVLLLPVQSKSKPLLDRLIPKYPNTDSSQEQ